MFTFVGPGAPDMRRTHLLCECPGIEVDLGHAKKAWLHFSMKYKHLGSLFASSQSFEPELRQRIGAAKATFQKVFRAVLGNRHFPLSLRIRFFQSLVCSKLFFGLGSWATPTIQQMGRLRAAYQTMLRKMCPGQVDEHLTNAQILQMTQSLDARVRIALDRLLYAQKMFLHGPDFLQQLVHVELHLCGEDSWLSGLQADLRWLRQVLPEAVLPADFSDLSGFIEQWQTQGVKTWKSTLRRAIARHRLQEATMFDALLFHKKIMQNLRDAGATFAPDLQHAGIDDRRELHPCDCGRTFSSAQGLALHRWKRHGSHAPEHDFITGATCPACLRFFWTSNRLAMHLAYIPRGGGANQCFRTLTVTQNGFIGEFQAQTLPSNLVAAVRLDALQAEGPLPCLRDCRVQQAEELMREIAALEQALEDFDRPADHLDQGLRLGDALTEYTCRWAAHAQAHRGDGSLDLIDGWIRLLDVFGREHDEWAAFVFQQWGEHMLPEVIEGLLDGEIEIVIDTQFAEAAEIFPRTERARCLSQKRARLHHLQAELQQPAVPHRPVRRGAANHKERSAARQKVPSPYHEQVQWQEMLKAVRWDQMPGCNVLPTIPNPDDADTWPCLLVVHLFSGRRREGDLHWQLQQMAPGLRVRFVILSMDTAVSPWYGDLWYQAPSWRRLEQCYALGLVAMTMVGSPCETFSEARFTPPPPDDPMRWPRPLRSSDWFFGLPDLTNRELRQVHAGTNFWLQGLQTLGDHISHGGLFLSEHPGIPTDPARPSTWRAPLTELLRQHPDVNLNHISQWQWGAEAVKPTGLLAYRMPRLMASMYSCSLPDARRPNVAAIGKSSDGDFRTAKIKEYPRALSRALATAFCDQVRADVRAGRLADAKPWAQLSDGLSLWQWIQEAAESSAHIRTDASVLPDYQPR